MALIKAELSNEAKQAQRKKNEIRQVSIEAQERLAEILNDSPHLVSLNGTEWEVRALRFGTQWLVAQKALEVAKAEQSNYGDIIKALSVNIPTVIEIIALCLLNDKRRIYKGGDEHNGFSEEYYATIDTLKWDCDVTQFGAILHECLQLLNVDFYFTSTDILEIFRSQVLGIKRARIAARK